MQKVIAVSQTSNLFEHRRELVDMIDQKLPLLLSRCGYIPVPVPNYFPTAEKEGGLIVDEAEVDRLVREWLDCVNVHGVVLTGGADFGVFPNRDKTESSLLRWAFEFNKPVLGICRGMQHLVKFFGGTMLRSKGHVGTRHQIINQSSGRTRFVNSFHNFSICQLPKELYVIERAEDGTIESLQHRYLPITGIMWHPEREDVFVPEDVNLIKTALH